MTFREELEQLDVEFLHGVPVKLPPATITSIINLVDKEVIGEDEDYDHKDSDTKIDFVLAKNELRSEQRAIIRSDNKNKGSE